MDNKPKDIISIIKKHWKIMNQNYILFMQKYTKD